MGIPKYNAECRAIVMRYSTEWESVVKRIGRWIDMKNNYKTMDISFMESVWWVFSQLYQKNLVYRGYKVMPYSTGCTTPLSNFEANMMYKDVSDLAGTFYYSYVLIIYFIDLSSFSVCQFPNWGRGGITRGLDHHTLDPPKQFGTLR